MSDSSKILNTTDAPTLTASPKRLAKKATDLGWNIQVRGSTTHHPAVLMASDGKSGQRGEVKTPAHEKSHVFMRTSHPAGGFGFEACWTDGKFVDATAIDALGFEVENHADYKPPLQRQVKDEPAKAFAARKEEVERNARRQDYEYNDGTYRNERRRYIKTVTELTDWLDDLLRVINPDKAPKPKTAKPQPQSEIFPEAGLEEWSYEE